MAVVRATVAYDGTEFFGWARQPGLRTVEGVLADAAGADLTVAGRTDRGVHALANVVSFARSGCRRRRAQLAAARGRVGAGR